MQNGANKQVHRILDASINRVCEGIRTLEEASRFALDDESLTAELKTIRHDIASTVARYLNRNQLLLARDTPGDVGAKIEEPSEYERTTVAAVVKAATSRTQQSMRVIEEYGKTIDAEFAKKIEAARYKTYEISANLELLLAGNDRLTKMSEASLYLLIDGKDSAESLANQMHALFDVGVDVFQLRDHELDDRTLYERALVAARKANDLGCLFIVNNRCDLAVAAEADGVHLGQEELPASAARQVIGYDTLLGISTHDIAQARDAVGDGADYIGCGPVYPGRTKQFDEYKGVAFLKEVADSIPIAAFGIGGIDHTNVDEVIESGIRRIAVTGAIRDAEDPLTAARQLKTKLDQL